MTDKQKRFAEEYLIDSNATQAAIRAGYSEKTARSIGQRLLTNVDTQTYLQELMASLSRETIADATEVLEMLTRVMRRQESETVVMMQKTHSSSYDKEGKKRISDREIPVLVRVPTRVCDANKAAELIGKRYGLFTDKVDMLVSSDPFDDLSTDELRKVLGLDDDSNVGPAD